MSFGRCLGFHITSKTFSYMIEILRVCLVRMKGNESKNKKKKKKKEEKIERNMFGMR